MVGKEDKHALVAGFIARPDFSFPKWASGRQFHKWPWMGSSFVFKSGMLKVLLTRAHSRSPWITAVKAGRIEISQPLLFHWPAKKKKSNQNTIPLPANQPTQYKEDKAAIWFAESFFICPTPLTMALVQTTCSPFHESSGGHFSKAAHHFLIQQKRKRGKKRITRDTAQSHWDFTLSVGCKCPYNVGFLNLVLLLPAAAILFAENKTPGLSRPTQ